MTASGIYAIVNTSDGKRYIGQSIDAHARSKGHIQSLRKGQHQNYYLQEAFDECGPTCFEIHILERVPVGMLDVREQEWIAYHHSDDPEFGYNLTPGGGGRWKNPKTTKLRSERREEALLTMYQEEFSSVPQGVYDSLSTHGKWVLRNHKRCKC